jgi:hypothetical protein
MVEHRHPPALAHVMSVGETLTHQVNWPATAHDMKSLISIERKWHIGATKSHGLRNRNRFLAIRFHIERDLSPALHELHKIVEHAGKRRPS